jgi:hypothetical protein
MRVSEPRRKTEAAFAALLSSVLLSGGCGHATQAIPRRHLVLRAGPHDLIAALFSAFNPRFHMWMAL